jgi:hypothetical protein
MYLVTGILMTIGGALMYTISIDTPLGNIYGYSIILAVGTGLTFNLGYTVAGVKASLADWSKHNVAKDINSAVSLQNIAQTGAILFALLISGQVFHSVAVRNLKTVLGEMGFSDAEISSAVSGTHSALFAQLQPELKRKATQAITMAMSRVYILSIVAGCVSVVCALGLKKERLFGATALVEDELSDENKSSAVEESI